MKKLTRRTLISLAALLPVIRVNAAVSGRFDVIVVGARSGERREPRSGA